MRRRFASEPKGTKRKASAEHVEFPEPYMDRRLGNQRKLYEGFVKDLHKRGLITWSRAPKERVAVFFVKKKTGELRMVIDARRSNRRFRPPPGVELCTAEGLGRIELDLGEEVE